MTQDKDQMSIVSLVWITVIFVVDGTKENLKKQWTEAWNVQYNKEHFTDSAWQRQ